jgi:hypothetical protein
MDLISSPVDFVGLNVYAHAMTLPASSRCPSPLNFRR